MIRAFAAALEDDDLLVRRSALDILIQSLRVDSIAVKKASEEDRSILMRAATSVVLRRDLSLNRRIYTWLLGTEESSQQQVAYLKANALDLLASTLRVCFYEPFRPMFQLNMNFHRSKCSTLLQITRNLDPSKYSSHCSTNGK